MVSEWVGRLRLYACLPRCRRIAQRSGLQGGTTSLPKTDRSMIACENQIDSVGPSIPGKLQLTSPSATTHHPTTNQCLCDDLTGRLAGFTYSTDDCEGAHRMSKGSQIVACELARRTRMKAGASWPNSRHCAGRCNFKLLFCSVGFSVSGDWRSNCVSPAG